MAQKAFLSMVLSEPFTFSIHAIGIDSNHDMQKIIEGKWMPWLRAVSGWINYAGIAPYYMCDMNSQHPYPECPDWDMGYITVEMLDNHKHKWHYYWSHGIKPEEERNMYWIVSEDHPSSDGTINSPLSSLLPAYRSLIKLRNAQDVGVSQAVRPVHVMEFTPSHKNDGGDNLTHLVADFDKAAGIGKARRERMQQEEIRVKTAELYRQLSATQQANTIKSTVQPTMWTDTPQDLLEEMDSGFSNRVVALRPDFKYTQAARPSLLADYGKAEHEFNVMAAAVMNFALEMLQPTGRSQANANKSAMQYHNERIKEQTSFFRSITQPALVLAYRKQFAQTMEDARNWRINRLGGDPQKVAYLYPELDVEVSFSNSSMSIDDELRSYWQQDGIISQETYAKYALSNKNIPLEYMKLTTPEWMKPKEGSAAPKPPKKKPKVDASK